jgi:N-ethylmaleimide reductase
MPNLFSPIRIGPYQLKNRVFLAPLTRKRALEGNVPGPLSVQYYAQRATAGLLITEATQVSQQGQGYDNTPGIHSKEQIAGWRRVTDAVHAAGGTIFLQLWHVGRISHRRLQPGQALPVAPSAIQPGGLALASSATETFETPRALSIDEIPGIVEDFRQGARNSIEAGFDGVEVHGANGYLLEQFLNDGTNHRTDRYGGSVQNRARLLLDVVQSVCNEVGKDRVGVRVSPWADVNDCRDSDPKALHSFVIPALSRIGPAYLHLVEPRTGGERKFDANHEKAPSIATLFRPLFTGPMVAAGGYVLSTAQATIAAGECDAIAFGRLFIANPDLPRRFELGSSLNRYDRSTFYGGAERGYTDYPFLEAKARAS